MGQDIYSGGAAAATAREPATALPEARPPLPDAGPSARITAAAVDVALWVAAAALLWHPRLGWTAAFFPWLLMVLAGRALHGSIGKFLAGLKVEGEPARFYLRETAGKAASVLTLGGGFALMFGPERLALHDRIARTRVVRVRPPLVPARALAVAALFAGTGLSAFIGVRLGLRGLPAPAETVKTPALDSITAHMPGVLTIYTYDARDREDGQGSGFLLTGSGIAVTNAHVIADAYHADAELGNGGVYDILHIRSYDMDRDIALVQLGRQVGKRVEQPFGLHALPLGKSSSVRVGDRIATISSPEGLSNTVTDGLIGSIRQDGGERILQITAPVSPGSSGGPVFDLQGSVIGIATFQYRSGQNLNFAVPAEAIRELLPRDEHLALNEFRRRARHQAAEEDEPDEFDVALRRAAARVAKEDYVEALHWLQRAQKLHPRQPTPYYRAAQCYDRLGLPSRAAGEYYTFLKFAGENDLRRNEVREWLARRGFPLPD